MFVQPARLLTGTLTIDYPVDFNFENGHPAFGAAFKWAASMVITPQLLGFVRPDTFTTSFDSNDIKVGDWVASSSEGKCLRVAEIVTSTGTDISLILEDVNSYNALIDTNFALDGTIPAGDCVVFEINEFGLPILGPYPDGLFSNIAQDNVFARFNKIADYQMGGGGGSATLGVPTDTTFADGAIKGWIPGTTTTNDAFDQLNFYLARALPNKPMDIQNLGFKMANSEVTSYGVRMADGAIPNNVNATFAYADPITAISSVNAESQIISEVGLGNIGTLSFKVNNVDHGSISLTPNDDTGSNDGLEIIADYDYPVGTAGIWQAMDVKLTATVPDGINEFTLSHSMTGSTTKQFVVETLLDDPIISDQTYTVSNPVLFYSSGVAHYTSGTEITYTMTADKVVGRTFVSEQLMGMASFPIIGTSHINYDTTGMPTPLAVDHGPITMADQTLLLDGTDIAGQVDVFFYANNAFRSAQDYLPVMLYADGEGQFLVETPSPNGLLKDIKRVALDAGDRPVVGAIDWATNFDSGSANSMGDLQEWDAPIIAGVARANRTDYSKGVYMPVGPDFSLKPTTQYLSFKIKRITNRLKLEIDGQYSGVFVKLPGVTNSMPNAQNGWWDGTKQADNAPLNWPGHLNASDGCLLSRSGPTVEFTFGNISSAASTDNIILVRFVLGPGDEIRSIRVI